MKALRIKICLFLIAAMSGAAAAQVKDFDERLTPQTKNEIVETLVTSIKRNYIFPDTALQIEKAVRANLKNGKYDKFNDYGEFADALTADLLAVAGDKHLGVKYGSEPPPRRRMLPPRPANEGDDRRNPPRNAGMPPPVRPSGGGDDRPSPRDAPPIIKILDDNIGYLKLNRLGDDAELQKTIDKAFDTFSKTGALIIDLRENDGGSARGSQYLASYLFDKNPVQLSSTIRRNGDDFLEEKFWTLTEIKGKRYLKKPVYVLVSSQTFSAAENFAYDLQALKRVVVTGEITGGGANPGSEFPLVKRMTAFIPTGRSYNYVTKTNWEGKGVQPDILTNEALEKAVAEITKNRGNPAK